jgi:hypothetical protein
MLYFVHTVFVKWAVARSTISSVVLPDLLEHSNSYSDATVRLNVNLRITCTFYEYCTYNLCARAGSATNVCFSQSIKISATAIDKICHL